MKNKNLLIPKASQMIKDAKMIFESINEVNKIVIAIHIERKNLEEIFNVLKKYKSTDTQIYNSLKEIAFARLENLNKLLSQIEEIFENRKNCILLKELIENAENSQKEFQSVADLTQKFISL